MYNKYMNATDRSDQILGTHNVQRKPMRWWKTFFHLIDISIVNSFILFRLHQRNNPDNNKLKRKAGYSLGDLREEVIGGLCGFSEYGDPPASVAARPPSGPLLLRNWLSLSRSIFQFMPWTVEYVWSAKVKVKERCMCKLIAVHHNVRGSSCMLPRNKTALQHFIALHINTP